MATTVCDAWNKCPAWPCHLCHALMSRCRDWRVGGGRVRALMVLMTISGHFFNGVPYNSTQMTILIFWTFLNGVPYNNTLMDEWNCAAEAVTPVGGLARALSSWMSPFLRLRQFSAATAASRSGPWQTAANGHVWTNMFSNGKRNIKRLFYFL